MIKNIKWLFLASVTLIACSDDEKVVVNDTADGLPLTAGSADFSKYVALGDSFAAGFSDGALFIEAQKGAYPNILAQQFSLVGGGDFTTPFMADNVGGFLGSSIYTPRLYLAPPAGPGQSPSPSSVALPPYSQVSSTTFNSLGSTFNNMGIPGAKSFHLVTPGYGSAAGNPYFARFASNAGTTVLADALSQSPTFFSLWIGGNDELGYATAGGDETVNPLTPQTTFDSAYNTLISQMTAGGRKGVIANLPYVTTLPYFYVIKYDQLTQSNLTVNNVNQVNALNTQLYGPLLNALTFLGQGNRINLLSSTGNNPMLMVDETLADLTIPLTQVITQGLILQGVPVPQATAQGTLLGQVFGRARQTRPTDLICLSASTRIGRLPSVAQDGIASPAPSLLGQLGVTFPLPDRYVLIPSEVTEIEAATNGYNATIEAAATANDLAFVNAKDIMARLSTTGISDSGYTLNSTYVSGGAFSLDGIHPSPRGYALIANEFIKSINSKYGSNLKGVKFSDYRIMFPPVLQ
ncbi:SGNH/GDSL hydrolase family protein [Flavobacterium dankookense]|uniref:GDSL-like lipase/acylhydrolase family protein n=1 Tax=Flavobacterium dankookense TaxID=706186 RepID=A0A4R6Q982_9FLAO|nr:SGNH/GDSL hydrolase family protein [Flavobacterium dankookense]TDP58841.1 GDSL-like lipase/acylhydrolase family protein [Flavobacterium dankookense]